MAKKNKILEYSLYALSIVLIFAFLIWMAHFDAFRSFLTKIESSSFDLRQNIVAKYKKPSKDIVILAIDDQSYEYIMNKYGEWPTPRNVWAKVINGLEIANTKSIVFDLLFMKPNTVNPASDNALVEAVEQYKNNVFLSMNFDNYSSEVRIPPILPSKIQLNVTQGLLYDNDYIKYTNARPLMPKLFDVVKNVGMITAVRDDDGILRCVIPVFKYNEKYYPNLSLITAMNILGVNSVKIENNSIILDEKHKIVLDDTQRAILNWYGAEETYKYVPLWETIKAIENNDLKFLKDNFETKIVYIGTTATSMYDIKSTPLTMYMPGVEGHATFLNNILDSNFIVKVSNEINFVIAIILSLISGYFVLKTSSVGKSFIILFLILASYTIFTICLMALSNLWLSLTVPVIAVVLTFILVYCEKYLIKSKDYEQTYKLAVTDGLTQLYNHRYFQEQMLSQISNFERYGVPFSLILIDIDFFKKFNDTYGHQSGDAVLKQVAAILKKNIRSSDIACRYGGEEMSIILTNTAKPEAVITANKICLAVRNNKFILTGGQKVNVTISVGVACVGENGKVPQEMIEYSDQCLYKAKEGGRNQVVSEV